jgi:hypothetical protein
MNVDYDLIDILSDLTTRQREYVINVAVKGMGKTQAAAEANLSAPPKQKAVADAIRAIYVRVAKKHDVELDDIVRGYLDSIDVARAKGESQSMIAGYTALAKVTGLLEPDPLKPSTQINILQVTQEQLRNMSYEQLVAMMPPELKAAILDGDHPKPAIEHKA